MDQLGDLRAKLSGHQDLVAEHERLKNENKKQVGLYSYGPYSYGLYSYGLYSYGPTKPNSETTSNRILLRNPPYGKCCQTHDVIQVDKNHAI